MLLVASFKPWIPILMATYGAVLIFFPQVAIGILNFKANLKGFHPAKANLANSPMLWRFYGAVLMVLAVIVQVYYPG